MKMSKTLASLLLVVCLCAAVLCVPASAASAEYWTTQEWMDYLDSEGIAYDYLGVDDSDNERVTVEKECDGQTYEITYIFDDLCENTSIRVWYVIYYDEADFEDVVIACNALAEEWKYIRFYADTSDNTVTAGIDLIYRDDIAAVHEEATYYVESIMEEALPVLSPYAQ